MKRRTGHAASDNLLCEVTICVLLYHALYNICSVYAPAQSQYRPESSLLAGHLHLSFHLWALNLQLLPQVNLIFILIVGYRSMFEGLQFTSLSLTVDYFDALTLQEGCLSLVLIMAQSTLHANILLAARAYALLVVDGFLTALALAQLMAECVAERQKIMALHKTLNRPLLLR